MHKRFSIILLLVTLLLTPYFLFVYMYHSQYDLISSDLEYTTNLPTTLFDSNGTIIAELYDEKRSPVKFEQIPDTVITAFTSAEDKNFFKHRGLDFVGIMRALIVDIKQGSIKQGGSTITQQLIKQLYTHKKRTIERKIIEILLIKKIEENFTKNQILEMYLNQIYFGHGVYGIKSAADFFFGKELKNIDIYEASLLALIPPAPNRYSPLRNPRITFSKHKQIIVNLVQNGHISKKDALYNFEKFWSRYLEQIIDRSPNEIARNKNDDKAPYLTDYIRQQLIEKYGEDIVYKGGLKVYTTFDLKMQQIAQELLTERITQQQKISSKYNDRELAILENDFYISKEQKISINEITALKDIRSQISDETSFLALICGADKITDIFSNYSRFYRQQRQLANVEGAFTAIEPDSGKIKVLVGGKKFSYENQLNRGVNSRRQPGSAFKPFVYASGIEDKIITAATQFQDLPMVFNERTKTWAPSNASDKFSGPVLVRKAITRSINTIAVLAYEKIGGDRIASYASRSIHIGKNRFTIDPTLGLGSSELTPLELTTGFACIANQGIPVKPYAIQKILDNHNKEIYVHEPKTQKAVFSRGTAFIMNSILQAVITNGTATSTIRNRCGFTSPAAGKTGTNSDYRDAWFAGYTPDLAAAVWIGCDSQKFTLGPGQYGANVAAPVWANFMKETASIRRKLAFPPKPPEIIQISVCEHSGDLPSEGCPVIQEYFLEGTAPKKRCSSKHESMKSIYDLF
ncbi:MAG TPA: PBP1A family penicillin-binding protein [Spirochaetota bacterium]|nr:PBP1A family penicillin-binding protein [Spirochaetota bacterium]